MKGVGKPVDRLRDYIAAATEVIDLISALLGLGILWVVYNRLPFALDIIIGGGM